MTSGGREFLKWVALLLMTGDHVNKALLDGAAPWLSDAARVVFPIFAFVLAWNLEHAGPDAWARALRRLAIAGLLVQPLHAAAFGFWIPVNILFTLAAGLFVAGTAPAWLRLLVLLVGAFFVDYQWSGVLFVAACVWVIRLADGWRAWACLGLAAIPLCLFNSNPWALLAMPLIGLFGWRDVQVPRWRWTFLGYYCLHLLVIALVISAS